LSLSKWANQDESHSDGRELLKEVYDSLYPKLVDLRNQIAPTLAATSAATASGGTEPGEFFSGMSYQDLQKRAPAPQPPAPSNKQ